MGKNGRKYNWKITEDSFPTGHAPYCNDPYHSEIYYCSSDGSGKYLSEAFRLDWPEHICRKYSHNQEGTLLEPRQFVVSVSNIFEAICAEDAIGQMATWIADNAYQAGYRVTEEGPVPPIERFIDAETIDWSVDYSGN